MARTQDSMHFRVLRNAKYRAGSDAIPGKPSSGVTEQRDENDNSWKPSNNMRYSIRGRDGISIYFSGHPLPLSKSPLTSTHSRLPSPSHCSSSGSFILGLDLFVLIFAPFLKIMRANFWGQWPKIWLLLALIGLAIFTTDCNGSPVGSESHRLDKRATQVSLIGYTFTNGVLAGTISVSNQRCVSIIMSPSTCKLTY